MECITPDPNDQDDALIESFTREVPEVASGVVQIRATARLPGHRAKVAVHTDDLVIDAVGACVGLRGSRIQRIVERLHGERIDVFPWNDAPERLIKLALAPARIRRVVLKPDGQTAVALVDAEQFDQALGPRGENRELASRVSGWDIEIALSPDAA